VPNDRSEVAAYLASCLPAASVRAGMATVLVELPEPEPGLLDRVSDLLPEYRPGSMAVAGPARTVPIAVVYDGPDLRDVARILDCSMADVVSAHTTQVWSVAMMGFAPGFGYLVPADDPQLDWSRLHRRDRPRERVPAGSVAVAAGMSAVYPSGMPGGWHLIGRTGLRVFDAADERDPSLLKPGDLVRFTVEDR
jgi:KipI family sensor histidine kinase inhibitor